MLLPAGEGLDLPVCEAFSSVMRMASSTTASSCSAKGFPRSKHRIATHLRKSAHRNGKIPIHRLPLGHISDQTPIRKLAALESDPAGFQWQQAGKGFEQCGLSRAIGPDQANARSAF